GRHLDSPRQPLENQFGDRCGRCGRKLPVPIGTRKNRDTGLERAAMSATEALKAARAAGVRVGIDGDDLVLEALAPPPSALLDLLSRHKAGIATLLRPDD